MKWRVFLPALILGFVLGALCMDLVAVQAMRGHLTGYVLEQLRQEDERASAAACKGDLFEESLRRWSVASSGLEQAVPYNRRHDSLLDPFLAAFSAYLGGTAYAQATTLGDLHRAKLIDALERAQQPKLASQVRARFANRDDVDVAELEQLAVRLVATDCKAAAPAP